MTHFCCISGRRQHLLIFPTLALLGGLATGCDNSGKSNAVIGQGGGCKITADLDWSSPTGTPPTVQIDITNVTVTPSTGESVSGSRVTIWVDVDGDGRIDVDEDTNGNGVLDPGEVDKDGDGRADRAEPSAQQTTNPPPTNPGPDGAGPSNGTQGIPATIVAPVTGGTVTIRGRSEVDVVGPGGGTPDPYTVSGGVTIRP